MEPTFKERALNIAGFFSYLPYVVGSYLSFGDGGDFFNIATDGPTTFVASSLTALLSTINTEHGGKVPLPLIIGAPLFGAIAESFAGNHREAGVNVVLATHALIKNFFIPALSNRK